MGEKIGRETTFGTLPKPFATMGIDIVSGESLTIAAQTALRYRLPLVAVLSSSGADVHDGVGALHSWGCAAREIARCSGVVPIIIAVTGPTVSGPALLLGMADVVIATEGASAYVVGPQAVADFTGERLTAEALGGAGSLRRNSGVAAAVVGDEAAAIDLASAVLSHLPDSCDDAPPRWPSTDPVDRDTPELAELIPATATGSYDMRDIARGTALASPAVRVAERRSFGDCQ